MDGVTRARSKLAARLSNEAAERKLRVLREASCSILTRRLRGAGGLRLDEQEADEGG